MKRRVGELVQKTQRSINAFTNENSSLVGEKERLSEHLELQRRSITEEYENSINSLMEKKKQLSEVLKRSLNEQKTDLSKQKNKICQKIEQASFASERLSRFVMNMENLSYDEFNKFIEELTKETNELEIFASSLPHIEITYMQFHENMNILDKSLTDNYGKRNSLYNKTDVTIGLNDKKNNIDEALNEAKLNSTDKKFSKKQLVENPGARTSRYAKPNADMFFLDENKIVEVSNETSRKSISKSGITNPFVEESLMAKMKEKPMLNVVLEE